jgi:DNA repair protein RadA/Sms
MAVAAKDKPKTHYACSKCGSVSPKWAGQCPGCDEWNTMEQVAAQPAPRGAPARQGYAGQVGGPLTTLAAVESSQQRRISSGLSEFDRVLGGGLVEDGSVILGGNPGAGKSTMLLQTGCHVARTHKSIYFTGEESLAQLKERGHRLSLPDDRMLAITETDVTAIGAYLERERPSLAIVDSIQSCYHPELDGEPGNISQMKTCAAFLNRTAKRLCVSLVLVGHINKSETLAGPMTLMHIVDCCLLLSSTDDARYRIMRAEKNRHGDTAEIGVFAMTGTGLKVVDNPSAIFLSRAIEQASGSIVTPLWEGSRPMLVEVQALVNENPGGAARPVCVGVDDKRVSMLMAVLQKHTALQIGGQAIYVNVVGGIRVLETGCDLPLLLAAVSSFRDKVIPADVMAFGEIGLSGEVRPCQNGQDRIREAAKLGFRKAIVPAGNFHREGVLGIEVIPVVTLAQAVEELDNL